jgi:hypothetical protein
LHVFIAVTEGYGDSKIRLRCVRADNDEELFSTEQEIEFPDPLTVVEMNLGFCGCEFPEAGEYRFQLYADGTLLCERKFYVSQVEEDYIEEEDGVGEDGR